MPTSLTRTADDRGRVTLPKAFATVIVQQINESEVRIRLASDGCDEQPQFIEESLTRLTNADRDRFLALLKSPLKPNAALQRAMAKHRARHA